LSIGKEEKKMKPIITQSFNKILKTIKDNWGKSVVEELAVYIKTEEPSLRGFTARNLWRMKQFYETYTDNPKLTPLVTEITWTNNLIILSTTKIDKEQNFKTVHNVDRIETIFTRISAPAVMLLSELE
jgi:hypothetical protein